MDDAPETIPNPEATKPADWDDEEDGEYTVPEIGMLGGKEGGKEAIVVTIIV